MVESPALTDLIQRAKDGDSEALKRLFDTTYEDLRAMASRRLNQGSRSAMLDTTALVHESYLRFANAGALRIGDRKHFFRYAGHVMRSVIVDLVRANQSERRGGDMAQVTLSTTLGDSLSTVSEEQIIRVNEALEELARLDPRMVQVVEMRYFAGMTELEIAEALDVTDRTVRRDWEKARLLLARELQ